MRLSLWCFAIASMTDLNEQTFIKYGFNLDTTVAEMHQMLKQAFGGETLSQTQTYKWFQFFQKWQNTC